MSNVSGSRIGLLGLAAAAALMGSQGSAVEVVRADRGPDLPPTPASSVRRAKRGKRLAPAIYGGNWQGKQYLSYREADRIRLLQLAGTHNRVDATAQVMAERAA